MTENLPHKSFQNALNARTDVDNSKIFLGEIPEHPIKRGGNPHLILSPSRAFGTCH